MVVIQPRASWAWKIHAVCKIRHLRLATICDATHCYGSRGAAIPCDQVAVGTFICIMCIFDYGRMAKCPQSLLTAQRIDIGLGSSSLSCGIDSISPAAIADCLNSLTRYILKSDKCRSFAALRECDSRAAVDETRADSRDSWQAPNYAWRWPPRANSRLNCAHSAKS